MFALFFSLYLGMFIGRWPGIFTLGNIRDMLKPSVNAIGEFLTSMFNNVDAPITTLGDILFTQFTLYNQDYANWVTLVSFVLALITSIGIVVMAIKGVKKAFGIFFMGIRR